MRITDVTLTLVAWDGIPPTVDAAYTGMFSGSSPVPASPAASAEKARCFEANSWAACTIHAPARPIICAATSW